MAVSSDAAPYYTLVNRTMRNTVKLRKTEKFQHGVPCSMMHIQSGTNGRIHSVKTPVTHTSDASHKFSFFINHTMPDAYKRKKNSTTKIKVKRCSKPRTQSGLAASDL